MTTLDRVTQRNELPPALERTGFRVRNAIEDGLPPSRMRSQRLETPFWGVRVEKGAITDLAGRATAYLVWTNGLAVVSHFSAALLWGIPLPFHWASDPRLHVSVPPDVRAPRSDGVAGHHVALHPMDVTIRQGVRTTTQARTLCDLAGYLPEEDLLAVADYLLWRERDEDERCTLAEIMAAINRHPTKRGMARLRKVVQLASDRADSAPESKMRYRILDAGLPAPDVNEELVRVAQVGFRDSGVMPARILEARDPSDVLLPLCTVGSMVVAFIVERHLEPGVGQIRPRNKSTPCVVEFLVDVGGW
jgi:hypothetical protein